MDAFCTYEEKYPLPFTQKDWRDVALAYWPENGYTAKGSGANTLVFEFAPGAGVDIGDVSSLRRRVEISEAGGVLDFKISAMERFRDGGDASSEIVRCLFDAELNGMKDILSGFLDYSEKNAGKWYARISVAILAMLVLGFGGYYLYGKCGAAESHIEISAAEAAAVLGAFDAKDVRVWLVPFSDFNQETLALVAARMSGDLGMPVNVAPTLPLPKTSVYNSQSGRFDAGRLGQNLKDFAASIPGRSPDSVVIGVSGGSIETSQTTINEILFLHAFDGRFAIIGTREMGQTDILLGRERLYKMVKRAVGGLYYGHPASIDRRSLMSGSLMNLDDIDRMGFWF